MVLEGHDYMMIVWLMICGQWSVKSSISMYVHSLEEVILNDVLHALVLTEDQCSALADG